MTNLSEMTKHIRGRLKVAGINARVRKMCKQIQVISPSFDQPFNAEQYRDICHVAKCNSLTFVRGLEINPTLYTDAKIEGVRVHQIDFYLGK